MESVYVSFEVAPDAVDSTCLTDAFIYVSADGKAWTKCWYKEDMPYGEKIKQQVKVQNKFRYIRTSTDGCAADWLNVAVVK